MPRVRQLTESGRIADEKKRLTNIYRNKAQANGISYTRIAQALDITPQAVSYQFKTSIQLNVMLAVDMLVGGDVANN